MNTFNQIKHLDDLSFMKYIGLIDDQRLLQLQEKKNYDSYLLSLE